ncbi:MAG: DUF4214 domain-containing protein [Aquihabitans sp.]
MGKRRLRRASATAVLALAASTFAVASPASAAPEQFSGPVTGNLAVKGDPNPFTGVAIEGTIDADAGTISAQATFPQSSIIREDAIPGIDAEVKIQVTQPAAGTGTYDSTSGALTLDASFQLEITGVDLINKNTGDVSPLDIGDGTCVFSPIEVDLVGTATGSPLTATLADDSFVIPEPAEPATDCGPLGALIIPNVAGPAVGEDPNSAELNFGLTSLGMQVDAIYQTVLERSPDMAGRDYWVSRLNTGTPLLTVAKTIAKSREGWSNSVNDTYVIALDRMADPTGLEYWTGALLRDQRPAYLAGQLFASSEAYGNAMSEADPDATASEAFVSYLYERVLDRGPDASGLAYWSGRIDAAPNGSIARIAVVASIMSLNEPVNVAANSANEAACGEPATGERLKALADIYRSSSYNFRITLAVAAATCESGGASI